MRSLHAAPCKKEAAVIALPSDDDEETLESNDDEEEEEEDNVDDADYSDEDYEVSEDQEEDGSEVAEEGSSNRDDSNDDEKEDAVDGKPTEEGRCKNVVNFIQRKKSLDTLKLDECKSYLRKHELRLSGTKSTCIKRILEHCRLKDGNGEKLYPQSSFVVNCTGDVCKGDVILFRQRVYDRFDKVKRSANIIGKRMVAGRVVKESYGASKQQHTFTVEVLWCKGTNALPPLFPLLVKGRNLYRLKTFRQRWSNELERSKVLAEKHQRGAAARLVRKMSKAMSGKGSTCHKTSSDTRLFKKRKTEEPNHAPGRKKQKSAYSGAAYDAHTNIQATTSRNVAPRKLPYSSAPANAHSNIQPTTLRNAISQKLPYSSAPSNAHANFQATITSISKPWNTSPRGSIYHASSVYPRAVPQRNPFYNHHTTPVELQPIRGPPQTSGGNLYLPPIHNPHYSFSMNAYIHHPLDRGRPLNHPYSSATTHADPWIANPHWQRPDYAYGPTMPSDVQFRRFDFDRY